MRSLIFPFQPVWHQCAHARTSPKRIHSHISLVFSAYLLCSHTLANSLRSLRLASRSFSRSSKLFVANHPGGASPRKPHSPLRSVLPMRQGKLVRPLFSPSYKSLLPELFRIHIHTKPRCGAKSLDRGRSRYAHERFSRRQHPVICSEPRPVRLP
jgi:hypothetical protein